METTYTIIFSTDGIIRCVIEELFIPRPPYVPTRGRREIEFNNSEQFLAWMDKEAEYARKKQRISLP